MKLIIDIPEDLYKWIKDEYDNPNGEVAYSAIENGIPYEEPKKNCFGCQGDKDFGCEDCLNTPKNDLISREALRKAIEEVEDNYDGYEPNDLGKFISKVDELIDEAPTVLFPLTVKIKDDLTDEDKETLKRLMEDYKPQVLNLETERPQGEWTNKHFEHADCSLCGRTNDYHGDFCKYCGADMRKGGAENE